MINSFYEVTFKDGSVLHSSEASWHNYSHKKTVIRRGKNYLVYESNVPISSIRVQHGNLEKILDVPDGCSVFQFVDARSTFVGETVKNEVVGRTIGLIKDSKVIEEYNISSETGVITGYKL